MNSPTCEYAWMDKENKKYLKPVSVSANEYVTLLMDWVETQINNEELFPSDPNTPFPKKFEKKVSVIFKRLFRVYAHIYFAHLENTIKNGEEAHLNTCFKHL
jgi:MOB kinase activator 1